MKNNFGQSVGLSINFPIFNAWNTRTQWERTKIGTTQYMLQDEQERLTLKTNIYNAYQDAFSSLQKYNASSRNVLASQKALDFARKRYDIGLLGTLDYIITQNNLFRARIEEVSNRYDFVFKMKVLEFYKGEGIRL
jgi:outer membrane protein